jgi:hypothetical protein
MQTAFTRGGVTNFRSLFLAPLAAALFAALMLALFFHPPGKAEAKPGAESAQSAAGEGRVEGRTKSEIRRPEIRRKSEIRRAKAGSDPSFSALATRHGIACSLSIGCRADARRPCELGLRISDFGFWPSHPQCPGRVSADFLLAKSSKAVHF